MYPKICLLILIAITLVSGCGTSPRARSEKVNNPVQDPLKNAPQVEPPTVAGDIIPAIPDGAQSDTAPVTADVQAVNLAPTALSEKDSMTSVSLDTSNLETLILMCGSGPLLVERDSNTQTISFTAEVVSKASGLDRARELASAVSIAIDDTAEGRYRVRLIEPQLVGLETCDVKMTVTLPVDENLDFDLDIQDSDGSIVVDGFRGNLSITSIKGSIEVLQSKGKVDISSGDGTCEVVGLEGSLKIRDGNQNCNVSEITGDVEIWGREGSLEVRYITGNVFLIDGRDGAVIQSIEGDVTLYGFDPSRCDVEGVSGSVIYKTGAP
ncbi:MAG: hypothetical protein P8K66_02080 [Planctomycetota bacterium]|nr:hypothetical protein [Planctomycetota bacterium]